MPHVVCFSCQKKCSRLQGHINENKKLGYNFFCSKRCESIARRRRAIVTCENCNTHFEKLNKEISAHSYCSRSCAATVNNQKFPKRGLGYKICLKCKNQFKGENLYCSPTCFIQSRKRHDISGLIAAIQIAANQLARVPAKRELRQLSEACIHAFGSWNKAVLAAGLQPNRSHDHRMYKRSMAKAADGHMCDSISEVIIDNWLTKHGIPHERNVSYPETRHKADWRIEGNTFVEYFGLVQDSPRYDRSIAEKQRLCRRHDIKLVAIYPKDLYPALTLESKLRLFV